MVDYDTMPAGREMDRLIALSIGDDIGERPYHSWLLNADGTINDEAWDNEDHAGPLCIRCHKAPCKYEFDNLTEATNTGPCLAEPAHYSEYIAVAWAILPKFFDFRIDSENWTLGEWTVRLWKLVNNDQLEPHLAIVHKFEDIPLAICRAALKALGNDS